MLSRQGGLRSYALARPRHRRHICGRDRASASCCAVRGTAGSSTCATGNPGSIRSAVKVRSYPVAVESGEELQKGPYVAEIFSVHVEDSYVIIET